MAKANTKTKRRPKPAPDGKFLISPDRVTNELNDHIRSGRLKTFESHPVWGAKCVGTPDKSIMIKETPIRIQGSCAGVLYPLFTAYSLFIDGKEIYCRQLHVTSTEHSTAWWRMLRWLHLKLKKQENGSTGTKTGEPCNRDEHDRVASSSAKPNKRTTGRRTG